MRLGKCLPSAPTACFCLFNQLPCTSAPRAIHGEGRKRITNSSSANRTGRGEITQDAGRGSRRSNRLVRSSRAQSTTRGLRRSKSRGLVSPRYRERTSAFQPDARLARSFLLHVPPPEPPDDDKDGTILSAREPRRSRPADVVPPEPSSIGDLPEKSLSERSLGHPDERQVGLDTDRSFVLYPVGKAGVPHLMTSQ